MSRRTAAIAMPATARIGATHEIAFGNRLTGVVAEVLDPPGTIVGDGADGLRLERARHRVPVDEEERRREREQRERRAQPDEEGRAA